MDIDTVVSAVAVAGMGIGAGLWRQLQNQLKAEKLATEERRKEAEARHAADRLAAEERQARAETRHRENTQTLAIALDACREEHRDGANKLLELTRVVGELKGREAGVSQVTKAMLVALREARDADDS